MPQLKNTVEPLGMCYVYVLWQRIQVLIGKSMLQIFITYKCYKYFDPIYEENKLDREIDTCLPRKKSLMYKYL